MTLVNCLFLCIKMNAITLKQQQSYVKAVLVFQNRSHTYKLAAVLSKGCSCVLG